MSEERTKLGLKNPPTIDLTEVPESMRVGDIDFLSEWNYAKLCEYRVGLIQSIASMRAQMARAELKTDTTASWIFKISFLLNKAEMMLAEVSKRLGVFESGLRAGAVLRAASEIFEDEDFAELNNRVDQILDQMQIS